MHSDKPTALSTTQTSILNISELLHQHYTHPQEWSNSFVSAVWSFCKSNLNAWRHYLKYFSITMGVNHFSSCRCCRGLLEVLNQHGRSNFSDCTDAKLLFSTIWGKNMYFYMLLEPWCAHIWPVFGSVCSFPLGKVIKINLSKIILCFSPFRPKAVYYKSLAVGSRARAMCSLCCISHVMRSSSLLKTNYKMTV